MNRTPVLCVVGPTASGKSALAVHLAHALQGEIVSMDSMQIYRGMDIGTAKPTLAEREGVPHHLLDVAEPTEPFTVAQYAQAAEPLLAEIFQRGKLPILAGGTGFYLRALTEGLHLGGVPSDPALREQLKVEAALPGGREALHARLAAVDPQTAARLHANDVQRVSRALEVYLLTGEPVSSRVADRPARPFQFCMLGTTWERATLYARINARVLAMLERGLLDEVEALLAQGVPVDAQAMQGIGYKELVGVVQGQMSLAAATEALQQNTRHYAKRQWTWFRAEGRVQWLEMSQPGSRDEALRIGEAFWREAQA